MLKMTLANTLRPFSDQFHLITHSSKYFLIDLLFFDHLALVLYSNKTNEICVGVKRMDIKSHPA